MNLVWCQGIEPCGQVCRTRPCSSKLHIKPRTGHHGLPGPLGDPTTIAHDRTMAIFVEDLGVGPSLHASEARRSPRALSSIVPPEGLAPQRAYGYGPSLRLAVGGIVTAPE
jgi:hypothetical protein